MPPSLRACTERNANIFENHAALIQRALAELVERSRFRDSRQIQWNKATPPPANPLLGSSVRYVMAWVAIVPFEIQAAFSPLMTYDSPSRRAITCPVIFWS